MRVTIFGTGYVGLVTGACLAEAGNHVVCADIDEAKIERLKRGEVPIYEPGLEPIVERTSKAGRLRFTTDVKEAVDHGLFQFIAVGTPADEDGSADVRYVVEAARSIARHMTDYRVIVNKSTVPVGTADRVRAEVRSVLDGRGVDVEYDVVSNPEFLKEGAAVDDFMKPERVVVGVDNPRTAELMRTLYEPFNRTRDRVIVMTPRSAELTKYAANALLAAKITLMNEFANFAERVGADIEHVRLGIGSDPRIGYSFIYPGCGYGGSCFPKDVKALIAASETAGYTANLLRSVDLVNSRQKHVLFEKMQRHFGDSLAGRTIALWGLSFKPNTDDMREAPSRTLMEDLWACGAKVRAYDPIASAEAKRIYGNRENLVVCGSADEALDGADALAIVTEWREFRSPDFETIKAKLRAPVIFDGRNLYEPSLLRRFGFKYFAIGRGDSLAP